MSMTREKSQWATRKERERAPRVFTNSEFDDPVFPPSAHAFDLGRRNCCHPTQSGNIPYQRASEMRSAHQSQGDGTATIFRVIGFDGPGKALTLELIADLDRDRIAVFFPTLRSEKETGAKRGCVVLASSFEAAMHEERSESKASVSLDALRAIITRLTSIPKLHARIAEIEADREARLAVIQGLQAHIAEIEADREARLAVIEGPHARIAEIEVDREARLAVIQRLLARIADIEA